MKKFDIRKMARIAVISALLCIMGPIVLPIPFSPVPISLAILGIFLAVVILDMWEAIISICVYILLGLVGMPVFSGFSGGAGKLLGPTGGYIIGYIPFAIIAALFINKFKRKILWSVIGMILGLAVCYLIGTIWLAIGARMTFKAALVAGVIPFIPFDLIKLAVSICIGRPVHRAVKRMS